MNKKQFTKILEHAIETEMGIKVSIKMPDLEKNETIFNPAENVATKLE